MNIFKKILNFGTKNFSTIGLVLALAIIAYLIFNPRVEYIDPQWEEDKSLRDTTEVTITTYDTVTVYDTTYTELSIPKPKQKDSTNEYTTTYSDPFINARITSNVDGILIDQSLWYVRRIDHLTTNKLNTITIDRYFKPSNTFISQSNRHLWIGGNLDLEGFTPNLSYQNDNVMYEFGYQLNEESITEFNLNALRIGAKIRL